LRPFVNCNSVLYQRVPKLFAELASAPGVMHEILSSLGSLQLLIIDDCGLSPVDADARHDLLEILEER
jgi:DNA replication protein DnaC